MGASEVNYPADFTQFILDCGVNPTWPQMTFQEIQKCAALDAGGAQALQAWFADPKNFGGKYSYTVSADDAQDLIDQYATNLSLDDLQKIWEASDPNKPGGLGPGDY
ncbi:MAG: hypothetical protein RIF32_07850 [Leptospirales bacterium]|jgi:hypothetical protein